MKRAILLVAFAGLCGAQTIVNGGRDYKGTLKASGSASVVDFSGAGSTAPVKAGTSASRPTACTQGQVYFATDVAAGQNLYFCTVTGAPGVWTQMSGNAAGTMTAGTGAPGGSCAPPMLYIDTTNQDLWYCSATNTWKKPTADTSGFATAAGTNTWTGYNNFSGGQWRPPESTVANLPSASGNTGKVFMVTDAATAGSCTSGGGSLRELCRTNGSSYECVGGCGSAGGGGGSGTTAYISSLIAGPDLTKTVTGVTHGFATGALLVGVYDNSAPRKAISAGWTVDPTTYDVAITFASPQSNYYVVINGGVGQSGTNGGGSGTVTSVAFSGGLIAVTNPSAAASMTVAGTSGGIPYFSSASTWASSGALAANGVVLGSGAGSAPTVTSADSTATHALFATAGAPAFRGIAAGDLPAATVRRTCSIDNDAQSATALTAAQFSGHCAIPAAATIVEVDVMGGTQTLTGSATAPTFTGTGSIQLGKYNLSTSGSVTSLLSGALATASGKACALTTTAGTCINGLTSSATITISTTALAAGDVLYVSAATADAAQTWYNVSVVYTVN